MGDSFFEKDSGWDKFTTSFEVAHGETSAFVGVLRSAGEYTPKAALNGKQAKPITVAQIAAIMVYGTSDGTIPARDFMSKAIKDNKEKISKAIKKLSLKVVEGQMDKKQAMGLVGQMIADMMVKSIDGGGFVANKPSTIARKGSSKPLIDKGILKGSIDFEVKEGK